jgi:hypothetical protein
MNLIDIYKFIEEKKGYKIPIKFKLINGLPLTKEELKFKGDLYLFNTKITSLPDNLHVGGDLYLQYTNITSLPDNLTVNGYLNLYNTQITDIPQNLKIYESLILDGTSLANYYTRKQIRKMIEEKGGFLKGYIH